MTTKESLVCKGCGAAVKGDRCDLCGTPVQKQAVAEVDNLVEEMGSEIEKPTVKAAVSAPAPAPAAGRFCTSCGSPNTEAAKFCSQCGAKLEGRVISTATPVSRPAPEKVSKPKQSTKIETETKPRIGLYVAIASAAVVILYLVSALSSDSAPSGPASPQPSVASSSTGSTDIDTYLPEDDALRTSLTDLKTAIEAETDPAKLRALREELVASYGRAGRLDLAGRVQEEIANVANDADSWALAGNLHFDWMEGQSGSERVNSAKRAARAYTKSLDIAPDNLDVRTDLGVAYLNDPASPMLAIQNTNLVLEADSNHVQANFNKGVMLAQIGRTQESIRLFNKVVSLSSPGEPPHERALEILKQLQGSPTTTVQ